MKYVLLFLLMAGMVSATDICVSKGFDYTLSVWNYTDVYTETYNNGSIVTVEGNARALNWTSDTYVDAAVYKSGTRTYTTDGGYSGKIPKTTLSNDIVYVAFCGNEVSVPEFGVLAGMAALVGALGVFLYRRK